MSVTSRLAAASGRRSLIAIWLGVLVLACGWTQALHIFVPPSPRAWIWFATGALLMVLGCRVSGTGPRRLSRIDALLCAAAGIAGVLLLERPHAWGAWVWIATAVVALAPRIGGLQRALVPGLWTTGIVLLLQAALLPLLTVVFARLHEIPLLAPVLHASLQVFAPDTMRTGSVIHLATATDSIPLTPTWEKLGAIPMALVLAGDLVVLALQPLGRRRLLGYALVTIVFAWLRIVVLFLVVGRFRIAPVFWDPTLLFVGLLPWRLALATWWRSGIALDAATAPRAEPAGVHPRWRAVAAGALVAAGLTLFFGRTDPGAERKSGRILIDESHSDWEWTTEAFDTAWYGGKSGYNYYCLADFWNRYYDVETRRDPLTPQTLSQFDVLVLKTPTEAYSTAEIDAIVDFVHRGGGLFLIGDHTNVFGSSTFLNPIAARFDMYFRYDATYNLRNLDLSLWQPQAVLPHPITRDIRHFLFATSCSIDTPVLSENIILGYGLRSMYLDYAELSYFPTKEGKFDYLFPYVVQMGGVRHGKGRVLGFTDSTTFSNFFMFVPGKPELALASIEWLNRTNGSRVWRLLAAALALAGVVLAVQALRRAVAAPSAALTAIVAGGVVAFAVVAWGCARMTAQVYPQPAPRQSLDDVVFDAEHGSFALPTTSLLGATWNNMHTFFVWVQRLGLVPRSVARLEDAAPRPPRAVVEINPSQPFTIPEIDWLVDYVRRGGVLFVLDTPENATSTASELLGAFGLSFMPIRESRLAVMRPRGPAGAWLQGEVPGDTLWVVDRASAVTGGDPLLVLPNGAAVAATRTLDRGRIIAFGASRMFGAEVMGSTASEPSPRMRAVYQAQYDLFERVAGVRASVRYTGRPNGSTARTASP